MKYPQWLPRTLTQWFLCIGSAALAFMACTLAVFLGPWCRDVSPTLATMPSTALSVKYAAESSSLASAESINLVGSGVLLVDHMRAQVDTVFPKVTMAVDHVDDGLVKASDALAVSKAKADLAIDAYASLPAHINPLLDSTKAATDSIPPTMRGLSDLTGDFHKYLNGPLTFATQNAGELEDTTNTAVGDFDARFLAPYTGAHPKVHAVVGVGRGILGLAEPGYYTKGILGK